MAFHLTSSLLSQRRRSQSHLFNLQLPNHFLLFLKNNINNSFSYSIKKLFNHLFLVLLTHQWWKEPWILTVNLFPLHILFFNVYKSSTYVWPHLSFIIDTGATYHICSNNDLSLSTSKFTQPRSIRLHNGHHLSISHHGDVQVHKTIVLKNFLFVPSYQYNLVSVITLTSQLQTFVLFTDDNCIMQDRSSKSSITLGILG